LRKMVVSSAEVVMPGEVRRRTVWCGLNVVADSLAVSKRVRIALCVLSRTVMWTT